MTLRNPHEQTEAFQPLGAPIRPEAPKPAASPAVVSPGIIRHADGTLGTAIPPPSAPAPVVRAMQQRDATIAQMHAQQAADWLTITKQVQDMPSKPVDGDISPQGNVYDSTIRGWIPPNQWKPMAER